MTNLSSRLSRSSILPFALLAITTVAAAQRPASEPTSRPSSSEIATGTSAPIPPAAIPPPGARPATPPDPPDTGIDCGDALSSAIGADTTTMPCWANIRSTERWDTTRIPDGDGFRADSNFRLANSPDARSTKTSFALGDINGLNLVSNSNAGAFGGAGVVAGLIDRPRWQLLYEESAAGADYQFHGSHALGLNRAALRLIGQASARLTWQANATNAYGTDAFRTVAPLDLRQIGDAEAPIADTVAYGLHAGRVLAEEEAFKMRYATSRLSDWDLSVAHTRQAYSDDGIAVDTIRARGELLHAFSPQTAFGVYLVAEHQTSLLNCTIGGLGLHALKTWSTRATLTLSAAANGASPSCGKSVEFTGDLGFDIHATNHTQLFLSANRGLSNGVLEQAVFLNSAVVGVRQAFTPRTVLTLSGAGILASPSTASAVLTRFPSPTNLTGTFSEASFSYPLGRHLTQETAVRHYLVSPVATNDNHTVLTFNLWFGPRRSSSSE